MTGKVQGQAKNLFGSYSPEYQQLIEGINLVLQLSLSTTDVTKSAAQNPAKSHPNEPTIFFVMQANQVGMSTRAK